MIPTRRAALAAGLAAGWTAGLAALIGAAPAGADLLVSSSGYSSVVRFDGATGAPLGDHGLAYVEAVIAYRGKTLHLGRRAHRPPSA